MNLTDDQLAQLLEMAEANRHFRSLVSMDDLSQAIPALIADLREATDDLQLAARRERDLKEVEANYNELRQCLGFKADAKHGDVYRAVRALKDDLREARGLVVALAPDALHEAEERKQIIKDSDELWRGRMQDAEIAHKAEIAELEAKLAGSQALLRKLSPLMINTGYVGANADIQKALQEVRVGLGKLETPELDAAIAKVVGPLQAKLAEAEKDAKRLNYVASEYIKLDPFDIPTWSDDASVGWRLSEYRIGKPSEVVIHEHYNDDPRAAIDAAIAAQEKP
jgi:hypothetical protein